MSSSSSCHSMSSFQPSNDRLLDPSGEIDVSKSFDPVVVQIDNPEYSHLSFLSTRKLKNDKPSHYSTTSGDNFRCQENISDNGQASKEDNACSLPSKSHTNLLDESTLTRTHIENIYNKSEETNLTSRPERRVEFADFVYSQPLKGKEAKQRKFQMKSATFENEDTQTDKEFEKEDMKQFNVHDQSNQFHFNESASPSFNSFRESKRSKVHRVSLLGRPIHVHTRKKTNPFYKSFQNEIYNFLERPRGWKAMAYHIIMFCMVFACLVLTVFSTMEEYEEVASGILLKMEIIMVVWFTFEFFFRVWSAGCRSRYQGGMGRLKYMRSPFCAIDFVVIIASIVVLSIGSSGQMFAASALRGLRFFQILRMVRMDRRGGTWKLLGSVVYAHRQELITTVYIGFLGLIFSSFLVYLSEKGVHPEKFNNFADALWWGVITMCTVGYGDMVPQTWPGKIVASFCSLLGISFFALPAGILGSGFALKVQQMQRQKHMIRRRVPAATLIQCLWRCYAADENSMSVATWKIYQVPVPSPTEFKQNTSFVSRFSSVRRQKSTTNSPLIKNRGGETSSSSFETGAREDSIFVDTENCLPSSISEESVAKETFEPIKGNSEDEETEEEPRLTVLTKQHKNAIRALRKIQYFAALRKLRSCMKPYDVKDVIEQYSAGHLDLLARVKNIQNRLDMIFGKAGSKSKDVYESSTSLASRIVKVERSVEDIETKLDNLLKILIQDRSQTQSKLRFSKQDITNKIVAVGPSDTKPLHSRQDEIKKLKMWSLSMTFPSPVSLECTALSPSNTPQSFSLPPPPPPTTPVQNCRHCEDKAQI